MQKSTGTLYVVATPIGNLNDISIRAVEVLAKVDVIFAEDTRHSRHLLAVHGIKAKLISLHDHNEVERVQQVIRGLQAGEDAALISDAGTPLINDPGYKLVAKCHDLGVPVSPVPGASAIISALSVSGVATDSFTFLGFPPAKSIARYRWIAKLVDEHRTMVFYESKHRIIQCLEDMCEQFGEDRLVAIARELTKQFETIKRDSLGALLVWIREDMNNQKGEFVIVVSGQKQIEEEVEQSTELLRLLLPELSVKKSVEIAGKVFGGKKNKLYKQALDLNSTKLD